jgi:hypothetical protein
MVLKACLFVAAMTVVGCGSGKTGSNPSNNGGATGQQCLPSATCLSCVEQNCNSEAMDAFGGGYMNDRFNGGQCPNIMACACTSTGEGSGGMNICAQQGGSGCVTAFTALTSCLNAIQCGTACTGNNGNGLGDNSGNNGLTVNANSMNFGNTEVGSAPSRCMVVTGPNASIIIPQILNDTSCVAGGCAFSTQPPYCETQDSCNVCVTFAPKYAGAVTATLSIASGLTVALSGVGTASPLTGTDGGTGQQCISPNCIACITQSCDSQAIAVFGAGYSNGNFNGGQCPDLMACSCAGEGMMETCSQQYGANCAAAFATLTSCLNATTCFESACNGGSGSGGTGGGSCTAASMGNTSGAWTLQIIAEAGTDDVSSCSSPGQTLTVAVSSGSFSVPTSAVTCGGAMSSTFSGTISSSGTVTGVFSGSVPDVCNIDACCSSPTSCATASNTNTPGACPGVILTKQ